MAASRKQPRQCALPRRNLLWIRLTSLAQRPLYAAGIPRSLRSARRTQGASLPRKKRTFAGVPLLGWCPQARAATFPCSRCGLRLHSYTRSWRGPSPCILAVCFAASARLPAEIPTCAGGRASSNNSISVYSYQSKYVGGGCMCSAASLSAARRSPMSIGSLS